MEKEYLAEVLKRLESCLEIGRQTRTLQLPKVLPARPDLEKLKGLAEGLLELHDFYKGCLLSWKYSGEPLSEEEITAMKEAGIDPEKTSRESKPMEIHGVSFEELDLNEEKKRYGSC